MRQVWQLAYGSFPNLPRFGHLHSLCGELQVARAIEAWNRPWIAWSHKKKRKNSIV